MKFMGYIFILGGVISIIIGIAMVRSGKSDYVWSDMSKGDNRTLTITRQNDTRERKNEVKPATKNNSSTQQTSAKNTSQQDDAAKKLAEEKGRKFEEWVVAHFKKEYYSLKEWRGDKYHNGIYAESTRYPDLELEVSLGTMKETFAVECKYRSKFYDGMEWATQEKIEIYNRYAQERGIEVFVALGVGGRPDSPQEVYLVPLKEMQNEKIYRSQLEKFKRPSPHTSINYYIGEKQLR